MEFDELQRRIREAGLLKRTYGRYLLYASVVAVGIVGSLFVLTITDNIYVQIANATFFGLALVQAGMLGHDCTHQQVFSSKRVNRFCGVLMWCLLGGVSEAHWYEKHNEHHKHVNHVGLDPDLNIPFIFSEAQIETKSRFVKKYIWPYQHILFFLMLPFVYPSFVFWTMKRLFTTVSWANGIELLFVTIHFVIFFAVPFAFLPFSVACVFLCVTLLVGGTYMGLVFAPNHKGEEVIKTGPTTWIHQIILTRNIYFSYLGFYFFGGLNLQIEHHLFSNMSRFYYPRAQKIVKAFCREHNIRYYETTLFGSMKEIYVSLRDHR